MLGLVAVIVVSWRISRLARAGSNPRQTPGRTRRMARWVDLLVATSARLRGRQGRTWEARHQRDSPARPYVWSPSSLVCARRRDSPHSRCSRPPRVTHVRRCGTRRSLCCTSSAVRIRSGTHSPGGRHQLRASRPTSCGSSRTWSGNPSAPNTDCCRNRLGGNRRKALAYPDRPEDYRCDSAHKRPARVRPAAATRARTTREPMCRSYDIPRTWLETRRVQGTRCCRSRPDGILRKCLACLGRLADHRRDTPSKTLGRARPGAARDARGSKARAPTARSSDSPGKWWGTNRAPAPGCCRSRLGDNRRIPSACLCTPEDRPRDNSCRELGRGRLREATDGQRPTQREPSALQSGSPDKWSEGFRAVG